MPVTKAVGEKGWKEENKKKGCLGAILMFLLPMLVFGAIKIVGG
jgi:hypothetical protein